jgi:flavin-binding protein dodecin
VIRCADDVSALIRQPENFKDRKSSNLEKALKEEVMAESIYKVIELVGTSDESWEKAAKNAVETAAKTLKNLRIAEVNKMDMRVENGKVVDFRARVSLSFKYED